MVDGVFHTILSHNRPVVPPDARTIETTDSVPIRLNFRDIPGKFRKARRIHQYEPDEIGDITELRLWKVAPEPSVGEIMFSGRRIGAFRRGML